MDSVRTRVILQTLTIVLAAMTLRAPAQVSRTADLVDTLRGGSVQARRDATRALGSARHEVEQAVKALIGALGDEDLDVRCNARLGLSRIGTEATPYLLASLSDVNAQKRYGAAAALERIGPKAHGALPMLIAALQDEDASVREEAARALGRWGTQAEPAVAALTRLLADPDPFTSGAAVFALSRLGKGSVPSLIGTLKDSNHVVRWCAAIALSKMGSDAISAIPSLAEALRDSDDNTRSTAAAALQNVGPGAKSAVPSLERCLYDRDEDVRRNADLALQEIDPIHHQGPPSGQSVEAFIDSVTPLLMAELHVPGVSIALVRNRSQVWSKSFGQADASRRTPVTRETLFEAASMTKPVFAYTVLKLAEEGRIDLDRPLVEYLSERLLPSEAGRRKVSARMVLSHTSGFPNWRKGEEERDGPLPVLFLPGSRFSYSGEGMYFLQKVVERITGEPLEAYAQRTLFEPIGLRHTSYVWTEKEDSSLASGHDAAGHFLQKTRYVHANAAYTLYTTAEEYARFLAEIMKPYRSAPYSLSARSIRAMLAHAVALDARAPIGRPRAARGRSVYWGLGWSINTTPSGDIVHHSGANRSGFRCFSQFSMRRGTGIVIMTNSLAGDDLWTRLINAIGDM